MKWTKNKRDLIICAGDSFTDPNFTDQWTMWPEIIEQNTPYRVQNLGQSAIGNRVIFERIVDAIETQGTRIKTICILWTELARHNDPNTNAIFQPLMIDDPRIWKEYFSLKNIHTITTELFRYINIIDQLGKFAGIEIIHWSAFGLINDESMHRYKQDRGAVWEYTQQAFNNIVLNNKYYDMIDYTGNCIGWPFTYPLSGYNAYDLFYADKKTNYIISREDGHPNKKGQQLIAKVFLKRMKS